MKIKILCFFILLICFRLSKAQEISLPFRNFGTDEGLSSSDVYEIIKDKKGYLWLATDNGLSRFDGIHFKNYYTEDGLASNSLTALGFINDTLYVSCYRKGIQRMINGIFDKNIHFNLDRISFIRTANSSIYMFKQTTSDMGMSAVYINSEIVKGGNVLYSSNKSTKRDYFELNSNFSEIFRNGKFYRKLPKALHKEYLFGIDESSDGRLFIGSSGKYFIVNRDGSFKTVTSPEISTLKKIDIILNDHKNRVWYRDLYGKAFVEINGKSILINKLLNIDEGVAIRNIFLDESNNNIWIATGGKGIFCFYNDYLENYSFSKNGISNKISALGFDFQNKLLFGTQEGFYSQSDNKIEKISNQNKWLVGQKIHIFDNTIFLDYGYNTLGHFIDETVWNNKKIINSFSPIVKIIKNNKTYYFNRNYFVFEKSKKNWVQSNDLPLKKEMLNRRSVFTYLHRNDTTFVGSNKGFYFLIWSKDKNEVKEVIPYNNSDVLSSSIIEIKADDRGRIYVLSEKGLAILNNNKIEFEGNNYLGCDIIGVNSIAFDNQNRIWLGTKRGLLVFEKQRVYLFNDKNGLNSSEINALAYDKINNQIWVGTNDGLSKININDFLNVKILPPKLKILGVSNIFGENHLIKQENTFPFDENYLKFHLSAGDFESPETIQFQYSLDGNGWAKTDSTLILPAVSFGKHTIYFRVKNDNSGWSENQNMTFEIEPPFYLNWFFWLVMSLFFIGLIYFILNQNRRKQLRKMQLKRQILDLKQQSMASMMNPHFIFNALNSIQYYINSNNLVLVNEYLSKFGKLIRMNLESSFNNSISLKSELTFLELYLSLEKLRFNDKFEYIINVSSELNVEKILLPPMFIQPFIENALIHGILPSERKGEIILTINQKENFILEIIIEDNGIGFEASSKLKKETHTSRSMEIIKQRIESMNDENKVNLIIFEENLAKGKTGSKVIINIKNLKVE